MVRQIREIRSRISARKSCEISPRSLTDGGGCASATLHCALESLVQGGFGLLVFLLGDTSLLVLKFELKKFFLQGVQQHRGLAQRLGFRSTWRIDHIEFCR